MQKRCSRIEHRLEYKKRPLPGEAKSAGVKIGGGFIFIINKPLSISGACW